MVYDSDFREAPLAAVDTLYPLTQQGADTPGSFVVPTTVSRITTIKIFISGIATDVVTGTTFAVHLFGGGIVLGNGWFVGPLCSQSGAAATSGGFDYRGGMTYKTNIPVKPGGTFSAEAVANGEDMGTAHLLLWIEYDGVPGQIKDGDYREDDIGAAANTLVSLTHRGAAVDEGDFKPLGTIIEVVFGAALDPTGDAAAGLNFAPAVQLSGPGLMQAGNYKFLGPSGPTQPDTDLSGNQSVVVNPERYITNIATKGGTSSIRAQAQNIESVNPSHAIIGLLYA